MLSRLLDSTPLILPLTVISLFVGVPPAFSEEARLLRQPAISAEHVAFAYAGDLWITGVDGGDARRLTTSDGVERDPHFSPDGGLVAFTGQYDGNSDVFVVDVEGGEPRRLTWHPSSDSVRGFTPDGESVLFASGRDVAPFGYPRFFTVGLEGGLPTPLPLPRAADGWMSADGERLAYQMISPWESEWRNYRGGQANPIRIIDLDSLDVEKLPWEGSNDIAPVWLGDTVYFLSDRDFAMNVWSYDFGDRRLEQRTHFTAFDAKNLSGGGGRLVFEYGGQLHTLDADAAGAEPRKLPIRLRGDFPLARPHWEDVSGAVRTGALSPTGKRAIFEARGEIFTVPAENGDIRNLTRDSGAADRTPSWSPKGDRVAWFSDRSGEYQLVIADQHGKVEKTVDFDDPTFYYTPRWSPDGEHLAFGDADRNLWMLTVASGERRLVDNEGFAHPVRIIDAAWSPDSKWIAYTKRLPSEIAAVYVYSLEQDERRAITDGMSNALWPAWDKSGKYLAFMASTDHGLNVGWLDLSSLPTRVTNAIYLAVLDKETPSPLMPKSDDEPASGEDSGDEGDDKDGDEDSEGDNAEGDDAEGDDAEGDDGEDDGPSVTIDFDGLMQRIIALDVPARALRSLQAGAEGMFFYLEDVPNEDGARLHRYSLEDREATQLLEGVGQFELSSDGKKLLYSAGPRFFIVDAAGMPKAGDGGLDLSAMRMKVDPAAEWRQIFREAWRYQRDYFYVDNVHGLDLDWVYETYSPWVDHVRHRADLSHVLDVLGGETSIGHSFVGGGDVPDIDQVPVGLLGADYAVDGDCIRIAKIYVGENWNPDLRSPLSGPGIDVEEGDCLLAVDGRRLDVSMNPYSLFDRTADRQTVITVNEASSLEDAREVTVVPLSNEMTLRARDWMEGNRRKVDELSGGKLAYVWLPDTGSGGYRNFVRYYFAQTDKKGAIIDERFNGGGSIADYVIDYLSRQLFGYFNNPVGDKQPFTAPNAAIWGPKVMIINEMAGSGGDMLPYMFRAAEIGPLVGTRTWGGLVGIWDVPSLIDGGRITAPRGGFYDTEGRWSVENEGVAPDIEVEQDPKLVAAGHDPQLEKAIEVALELLETEGVELLPQPPDPVRVKRPE